jgi:CHAT domain
MFFDEQTFIARVKTATVEQLAEILARPTYDEERALRNYYGEEAYRLIAGMAGPRRGGTRGVRGPLFDERAFIERVEAANTEELAEILRRPSADQERALRIHLGDERFRRMHALAVGRTTTRGAARSRGNVVVIPGIMGSELTAFDPRGAGEPVWLSVLRIMSGRLDRLQLDDAGLAGVDPRYDVRASGILKRYYGELLLSLSRSWTVRAYWFDWRKDINLAADELASRITGWFGVDASVHIVAHSMGGLVARTFIANNPGRWKRMAQRGDGGRLVMLGTPNYGSYLIPQAITGLADTIWKLDRIDIWHDLAGILKILSSFVGNYQMLPSPAAPGVDKELIGRLYQSATYGPLGVPQRHLDNARRFHERLDEQGGGARMAYVAGCNRPTAIGIKDITQLASIGGYEYSDELGDGCVPHGLGLLEDVATYYVDEEHSALPGNPQVLAALDELLRTGATAGLSSTGPRGQPGRSLSRGGERSARSEERIATERREDEGRLEDLARQLRTRSAAPEASVYVSPQEREAEEILMRHATPPGRVAGGRAAADALGEPARIEVGLVYGGIEAIDALDPGRLGDRPVEAIAVGHYIGVTPANAELALDRAISRAVLGLPAGAPIDRRRLLLTQYTERGTVRGDLGQPFFVDDPRAPAGGPGAGGGRLIVLAGMGLPGRFGSPELVVLARELCWVLGRLGKRHLATVLIGSGNGCLPIREAVAAWMRGVSQTISGVAEEQGRQLARITFVEADPRRIMDINNAIREQCEEAKRGEPRLVIDYEGFTQQAAEALGAEAEARHKQEWQRDWERQLRGEGRPSETNPARITLSLDRQTYRFGAVTDTASIPEREIPLDPALVMRANDELAAEWQLERQYERGRFLGKLLVPADLRTQLQSDAPVVMLLDATTARIHWEMVAQSDPSSPGVDGPPGDGLGDLSRLFLGTARGFTRQLRTTFAPLPEPPPPPRRTLRVLVIADTAEDNPLPGAEQEGIEVADLFESFSRAVEERRRAMPDDVRFQGGVEVVRLLGPREATRTNVLRELLLRPYDVLHYAGHCMYDAEHPSSSGWIFSDGERLSVNELRRIDHIPKFVFSNACESGITPDRAELRTPELAPSFAEAFFERGVANFVCTAWPVDDAAARQFALTLYCNLLGLQPVAQGEAAPTEAGGAESGAVDPAAYRLGEEVMPMHQAMRRARLAIGRTFGGGRTWGAYQHYGNPNYRFFDHTDWGPTPAPDAKAADAGSATADGGEARIRPGAVAAAGDGRDAGAGGNGPVAPPGAPAPGAAATPSPMPVEDEAPPVSANKTDTAPVVRRQTSIHRPKGAGRSRK